MSMAFKSFYICIKENLVIEKKAKVSNMIQNLVSFQKSCVWFKTKAKLKTFILWNFEVECKININDIII